MSRSEELITQLEAEIVKRDSQVEDLEAQLEDTEERRDNAARNSSAFEARMGDLQVDNGRLTGRIAELEAALARVVDTGELSRVQHENLEADICALVKAQQPSTGVVMPERAEVERQAAELREERDILQKKLDRFYSQSHGIPALSEIERLNAELAALKAGQGEAVAFEDHWPTIAAELPEHHRSNYCAGDVYSAERDAALAGWTAHAEICQAPPASADAVSVPRELLGRLCPVTAADGWKEWNTATAYEAAKELGALLARQEVKS